VAEPAAGPATTDAQAPVEVAWAVQMPSRPEEPRSKRRGRRKAAARGQAAAAGSPAAGQASAGQASARVTAAPSSVRPARRRPAPAGLRRVTRVPLRALVAAVVVAVLLVGWLALRLRDDRAAAVAREQAVAAARLHAPDILSYDYRHLDQDFAKAQEKLTGKFKEDYARTTVNVVKPVAVDNKAVVEARVVAASTIWARPGEAQVLLFVNQQTTTAKTKGPRVDLNRVRMTLRRTERGWLVSNVEAL
jgi:Mce-associated membrane protein